MLLLFFLFFLAYTLFLPALVLAEGAVGPGDRAGGGDVGTTDITQIPNPLGEGTAVQDPRLVIGRIIGAVLGIIGSIALAIFVYGGFTWMTSAGNERRVEKGKEMILWAALGIVVIFTSYAIISFIITAFTGESVETTETKK